MSTTDRTANGVVENLDRPVEELDSEHTIGLELAIGEGEALRAWLLKPASDGSSALEDPAVSRVLTKLGHELDAALATMNVRRELEEAGIAADHLSDQQMRELARRLTAAARPSLRN
jgi:hypothetical protein